MVAQSGVTVAEMLEINNWEGKGIFQELATMGIWLISLNMLCIFCERFLASRWDSTYEITHAKVPWIGIILILLDWLTAFSFALMEYRNILSINYIILGALVIEAIALFVFSLMPRFTFNKYIKGPSSSNFSLSQRFQMSENYKAAKMLFRILWVLGGSSIFAGVVYSVGVFVLNSFVGSQLQLLFGFCYLFQGIAYPIIIIFHDEKIKQSIFLMFCCCSKRLKHKQSSKVFNAQTITGQQLVITDTEHQRELYFQEYQKAWN
ncbi:hypothetical protein FO519_003781 [Halicephalobus sp. NKZ332]|nr:hypothetical protein FO519_003781 [Halicephalobus sp. NKZ332]